MNLMPLSTVSVLSSARHYSPKTRGAIGTAVVRICGHGSITDLDFQVTEKEREPLACFMHALVAWLQIDPSASQSELSNLLRSAAPKWPSASEGGIIPVLNWGESDCLALTISPRT
jgi:hypothetical protein